MPPAARLTDMHTCPMVTVLVPHVGGPILAPGEPTVLIGFLPAARMTDTCVCVGPPDMIAMGSPTVLIGGLMAARMGDPTVHGGVIVLGEPTVMIGEAGGGGGGGGGGGAGAGGGGGAGGASSVAAGISQSQADTPIDENTSEYSTGGAAGSAASASDDPVFTAGNNSPSWDAPPASGDDTSESSTAAGAAGATGGTNAGDAAGAAGGTGAGDAGGAAGAAGGTSAGDAGDAGGAAGATASPGNAAGGGGGTKNAQIALWRQQHSAAIKQALADQRKLLLQRKADLEANPPSDQTKADMKKWLGSDDDATRQALLDRTNKELALNQNMTPDNFYPADPPSPGTFAYVYPNDPDHKVFLDSGFDNAPATGMDSKAGTLAHEMSHYQDIGNTKDVTYGQSGAQALAKKSPSDALNNADNYEYFVESANPGSPPAGKP